MIVQVFDQEHQIFRCLTVYGLVCYDFERHFILYIPELDSFCLQVETTHTPAWRRHVHFVHVDATGFVRAGDEVCASLSDFCKRTGDPYPAPPVPWIAGYPDAVSDAGVLRRLMQGDCVPRRETGISLREVPTGEEWYEIKTQAEADLFLWGVIGFHDAHIDAVTYREPLYIPHEVSVIFDCSEWNGCRLEYRFIAPTETHITNGRDKNMRDILEAVLSIGEDGVFWADAPIKRADAEAPLDPTVTYIRAERVMVRRVD